MLSFELRFLLRIMSFAVIQLINELEMWLDLFIDNESKLEVKQNKYWKIDKIPQKGFGMMTITNIPAFTTILIDKPIITEPKDDIKTDNYDNYENVKGSQLLLNQFNELPSNKQKIVMNLANVFDDKECKELIHSVYLNFVGK